MHKSKPRKPWVAVVLTTFTIGLGHVYSGSAPKGIILFIFQGIIPLITIPVILAKTDVYSYIFAIILGLAYFIYCIVDVLEISRANKQSYQLKNYNKWYIYLAFYILANLIIHPIASHLIKENTIKAYKIPSGAMMPTLLIGDHILVNKHIYKSNNPQKGDIIVFEYPINPSIDYVKRLVAVSGDTVEIKNKKLFINSIEQNESYITHSSPRIIPPDSSPRDNYGPITVPENSFFVLGDNRDNSHDSRFWGFVNKDKIQGKVVCIYWSWDTQLATFSSKRLRSIRWNRIGSSTEVVTN